MERGEADDERSARLPEHGRHLLPLPLGLGTRQGEKLMQGVHKELCVLFFQFTASLACIGCSLNIVFFPLNVVIFLNSASSAAALVFYLSLCTHTDTEGKPREARVRNIF